MLLEPLMDALALVRDRIKNFEREFSSNEAQTRLSLVDPVLTPLGWDPQDPSAVRVEFPVRQRSRNNKADYALLDSQQKPIAFVEAKRLGTDLGLAQDQLFEYGSGEAVPYAIATDGAHWAVYKRERQGTDLLFKQLLAVSITNQPPTLAAIKLLSLWHGLLTSQSSIDQIAPALDTLDAHLTERETVRSLGHEPAVGHREERLEKACSAHAQSDQDSNGGHAIETFTLHNPPELQGRRPVELAFPEGTRVPVRGWAGSQASVLLEVVRWLLDTDQLIVSLPWNEERSSPSKRNVLQSTKLIARTGKEKWQLEVRSNLFLLLGTDPVKTCNITSKLLTDCGISSSDFKVTLAPKDQ